MIKEFIIEKRCCVCSRWIKTTRKEQKNKKFKCSACKKKQPGKTKEEKYCCDCGFILMEFEKERCHICELKQGKTKL